MIIIDLLPAGKVPAPKNILNKSSGEMSAIAILVILLIRVILPIVCVEIRRY